MASRSKRELPEAGGDDVDRFIAQRAVETPDIDTGGMAVFGRIYRIAARIAPHKEALFARYGLERGEFDVLASLQRTGKPYRLSPTALCDALMVSSGGLTHRLKRLEKAGLVERIASQEDRRSLIVGLTRKGYDLTLRAFEEDMRLEQKWLTALSSDERRALADLLRKLGGAVPPKGGSR